MSTPPPFMLLSHTFHNIYIWWLSWIVRREYYESFHNSGGIMWMMDKRAQRDSVIDVAIIFCVPKWTDKLKCEAGEKGWDRGETGGDDISKKGFDLRLGKSHRARRPIPSLSPLSHRPKSIAKNPSLKGQSPSPKFHRQNSIAKMPSLNPSPKTSPNSIAEIYPTLIVWPDICGQRL